VVVVIVVVVVVVVIVVVVIVVVVVVIVVVVAVVVVVMVMVVVLVVVVVVVIQFTFHILDNSHEGQLLPIIKTTGQEKYCRIQMIKIEKQIQKKGKKRKRSTPNIRYETHII
jgi:hypothetical protein